MNARFWPLIKKHPGYWLALQFPLGLLPLVDEFIPDDLPNIWVQATLLLGIFLPLFILLSTLATAFTFSAILHHADKPSIAAVVKRVLPHTLKLFGASFLAGLLTIMGLSLILPGIYFGAIFLFVTHTVIQDPSAPISVYLTRSKKVAKKSLGLSIAVAVCLFASDFITALGGELMGQMISAAVHLPLSLVLTFSAKMFLSMVVGATINVWVSLYFLRLQEESLQKVGANE